MAVSIASSRATGLSISPEEVDEELELELDEEFSAIAALPSCCAANKKPHRCAALHGFVETPKAR